MQIRFSRVLLFVAMTVLFTACPGGIIGGNPNALGDSLSISAKIANWTTGRTATVRFQTSLVGTPDQVILAESLVATDGTFSLTVPASVVKDNLLRQFRGACTTYTVSPPDFKSMILALSVFDAAEKQIGRIFLANQPVLNTNPVGIKSALYFYANQHFTAKGPCFSSDYQQNWDINGSTGWNVILGEKISDSGEVNFTSTSIPTDLKWYFTSTP